MSRILTKLAAALLISLMLVVGFAARVNAQGTPAITSLNVNSVRAGSPGFTLIVQGRNFFADPNDSFPVVRLNGTNRPTTIVTRSNTTGVLTVQITAADIANPGVIQVTVFDQEGPATSAPVPLVITVPPPVIPPPILSAVSPSVLSQGARQMRVTLTGRNFKPGSRIIIRDPNSNPSQSSDEAIVERVMFVNETTLIAFVSLRDQVSTRFKFVDVISPDGQSTVTSSSTKTIPIAIQNSLAAPTQSNSVALLYPRAGTVIAQNEPLIAQAIVGGVGTGTISGQWVWDGVVVEQFTTNITAGERVTIKTTRALPTQAIGSHTLSLHLTTPNPIQTFPIRVAVTPGNWRALRLLRPNANHVVKNNQPPMLEWTIVPGAMKYQVGISDQPYFDGVNRWIDVQDSLWHIPARLWQSLPFGKLYWTVRTVDANGDVRPPALLRTLWKFPDDALSPKITASNDPQISWEPATNGIIYRANITTDPACLNVIRRFLTTRDSVNVRSALNKLEPSKEYFWFVEAFAPDGRYITMGKAATLTARANTSSLNTEQRPARRYEIASLSVPPLPADARTGGIAFIAQNPAPQQTIATTKPTVSVRLKDSLEGATFTLIVDDTDVTPLAKVQGSEVSCATPIPLNPGTHTIIFGLGDDVAEWNFSVNENANVANANAPRNDAEESAPATLANNETPEEARKFLFNYEISSSTQAASGSEQEATLGTLALQSSYRDGPWLSEVNGNIAMDGLLHPQQGKLLGLVNDYAFRMAYQKQRWDADLRFGLAMPQSFSGAQFVTSALPRIGAEAALRTPIGKFTAFRNVDDQGQGTGDGLSSHQSIQGASFALPLPAERATFRLMWLGAEDIGAGRRVGTDDNGMPALVVDPLAAQSKSDLTGALFTLRLNEHWQWDSEYAVASFNADKLNPLSSRLSGRALRSQIYGQWRNTAINLGWRDVTPGFLSNVNSAFTQLSQSNRRGIDFSASRQNTLGRFATTYQFLQSDLRENEGMRTSAHNVTVNYARTIKQQTTFSVEGNSALTSTDAITNQVVLDPLTGLPLLTANQRRTGIKAGVVHSRRTLTLTFDASRNWFRDRVNIDQGNTATGINVNGQWQVHRNVQLIASSGLNELAGNPVNAGRNLSKMLFIQPVVSWRKTRLTLIPMVSYSQMYYSYLGGKLEEMRSFLYGARAQWQLPGMLRFGVVAFEASMNRLNPSLQSPRQTVPRIAFQLTMISPTKAATQ